MLQLYRLDAPAQDPAPQAWLQHSSFEWQSSPFIAQCVKTAGACSLVTPAPDCDEDPQQTRTPNATRGAHRRNTVVMDCMRLRLHDEP